MEQLYRLKKAAHIQDVSPEFLKKLRREGRLRIVKIGRVIRVSSQELERLCREEFREERSR